MDCVRLRAQTVPVSNPVSFEEHTAYLVLRQDDEGGIGFHTPAFPISKDGNI